MNGLVERLMAEKVTLAAVKAAAAADGDDVAFGFQFNARQWRI